jgi:hypothetical protein
VEEPIVVEKVEPLASVVVEPEPVPVVKSVTAATISALKKDLKRMVNQRAIYVASRLSGPSQDVELKECEGRLSRIDSELSQFRLLMQRGETKLPTETINSEFLKLNKAANGFTIESLISRLEVYKSSEKDKVTFVSKSCFH